MSLETAMAVLDKAHTPNEPIPGANPDTAKIVEDKKSDSLKDININLSVDSLKADEAPKENKEALEEKKPLEPPKEEEKKETKEQMSRRFAILAQKEKVLLQGAQKLKAREQELAPGIQAIENFEKFKAEARANPMLALKEIGVSYDDLTKFVLQGKMPEGSSSEVKAVREEMQRLRQELNEKDKRRQERSKLMADQRVQQEISAFRQEVGNYIKSNAEKFELINLNEASHLVSQKIESHFAETKQILPTAEAAEAVERYLEDLVDKNTRAKKLADRYNVSEKRTSSAQQPRTLSNEYTSSAPSLLPARTEADRMRRALAKLPS